MASEIPQTRCFLRRRSTVFCKWRSDNLGAPVFFIERPPGTSSSSRHRAANVNPDTPVHRTPGEPLLAFIRKWNEVVAACAKPWLLPTARLGQQASLRRHGGGLADRHPA